MEVTGKMLEILPAQSGSSARGEWKKQEFIIETEDQFPKKICIANWNDKIDINNVGKGEVVTVSINIESREFNGKWYTDVKAWKMTAGSPAQPSNTASGEFAPPPPPPPNLEDANWENSNDVNDLPF
jgi:hypothetical protein